ncbi:hypothetical protein ACOMD4_37785 [Streptomyces anulatus]|uniref:hypothetical protein n=1 Tax=Streptomyces TaxID=1883 RepID=UPI000B02ED0B|nr:hypothetical protein [Streptomyces sp. CB02115]
MADTTTRQLLAHVLDRVTTNPDEWSVQDTNTITRLRAAAEYEESAEKVISVRNGR